MKVKGIGLVLAAVCLLTPRAAHADGKVWAGHDYAALAPLTENDQMAAIAHEGGIERMVIAVSADLGDQDKALWMFPVPGTPDQVKLDVVDTFPRFSGYDPREDARDEIGKLGIALRATQIYPAVLRFAELAHEREYAWTTGAVSVHETVEKWGIHGETVTATSEEELARYLEEQGVAMPQGELSAFGDYLSKDYVLVLVWIGSREEVMKKFPGYGTAWDMARWPCVHVRFPTERPFYPLRPTSSYGSAEMRIRLFLIGYFDVANKESLGHEAGVRYYRHGSRLEGAPKGFPQGTSGGHMPYTRVWFQTAARNLTEDLWFLPVKVPSMAYGAAIDSILSREYAPWSWLYPWALCLAGLSYVSAGLASLVVYRSWRRKALMGLWNMLTLVGLAIAVFTRPAADNRERNLRALFFLAFGCAFLLLSCLFEQVLLRPLG